MDPSGNERGNCRDEGMVPITVEKQDVIAGHVRLSALQRLHTVEERKAALAAYGNSMPPYRVYESLTASGERIYISKE